MYEDFLNKKGFKHWIRWVVHSHIWYTDFKSSKKSLNFLDFFRIFLGGVRGFFWVNNPSDSTLRQRRWVNVSTLMTKRSTETDSLVTQGQTNGSSRDYRTGSGPKQCGNGCQRRPQSAQYLTASKVSCRVPPLDCQQLVNWTPSRMCLQHSSRFLTNYSVSSCLFIQISCWRFPQLICIDWKVLPVGPASFKIQFHPTCLHRIRCHVTISNKLRK